jgi:YD repeat-containing protein
MTYHYDAMKRLTEVDDAAGGVTSYTYDQVGNRTGQQDANGHLTSFEYDQVGRRARRTLPLGQYETMGCTTPPGAASSGRRIAALVPRGLYRRGSGRGSPDPIVCVPTRSASG